MKLLSLIFGTLFVPLLNYAQTNSPDTLKLDIKTGHQLILIGDDLNSFKTIKVDSMIKKALFSVKDSLKTDKETNKENKLRSEPAKRPFSIETELGAGVVWDKLSPVLSVNFLKPRKDYYMDKTLWGFSYLSMGLSLYYLFNNNNNISKGSNLVFLELSSGGRRNEDAKDHENGIVDDKTFGIGYLVRNGNGYFERNTFKIFSSVVACNGIIKLRAELNITDNFRRCYPGLTIVKAFVTTTVSAKRK